MTTSPSSKKKSNAKISASIRKPKLGPAVDKLSQALDFAQKNDQSIVASFETKLINSTQSISAQTAAENTIATERTTFVSAWSLMPKSNEARQIMRKRAEIFARQVEDQKHEEIKEQYVRFILSGSEVYGISYRYIEEILPATKITAVPCTPNVIAGIINYRGELLTILDLKQIFNIRKTDKSGEGWVIVVRNEYVKAGIIADEVDDNDEFIPAQLVPSFNENGYVQGIQDGKIVMLNIAALLTDSALIIDEVVT